MLLFINKFDSIVWISAINNKKCYWMMIFFNNMQIIYIKTIPIIDKYNIS
jgi:hypothetical protein